MNRKHLAFSLQQQCADQGIELKRSHAYELIAAYWSFASQAAMDSQGLLVRNRHSLTETEEFGDEYDDFGFDEEEADDHIVPCCVRRAQDLGYSMPSAELVWATIDKLINAEALSFIDYDAVSDEYWDIGDLTDEVRSALNTRAENKQPGALYALASLCRPKQLPTEAEGYWYRAQQEGQTLNEVQKQFAEEYAVQAGHYASYLELLSEAAMLGHPKAAFEYALHDEPNAEDWFRRAAESGYVEAQAAMAHITGLPEWHLKAAEGGDFECLYDLACEAAAKNDEESAIKVHKWVYLAELYGHNLTQTLVDNYEDYGPVNVIFEGIRLPQLAPELMAEAARTAQGLFDARRN